MFFTNLPIGKKLVLAFTAVLLAIASMGAVIFVNLQGLSKVSDERSAAYATSRTAVVVEFKMARQENSYRGFLISSDPYYLERPDAHRANFKKSLQETVVGRTQSRSSGG